MDLAIVRNILKDATKDAKQIAQLCNEILEKQSSEVPPDHSEQLGFALELFTLSPKFWSAKRHPLIFDLLRTTLRNINDTCREETTKKNAVEQVIRSFAIFSDKRPHQSQIVTDICSVLVEVATNFAAVLCIQQTIELIELCHTQIRLHIVGPFADRSTDSSKANALLHHFQALIRGSNFVSVNESQEIESSEFENFILSDDTVLSAINLAGSQVCHAFTKNRIFSANIENPRSSSTSSVLAGNDAARGRAQVAQDFAHLLLYLSKKLKMKQSFWHTLFSASTSTSQTSTSPTTPTANNNKRTADFFVLAKVYNCFYLKCIHYTLLSIPDAWPLMSSQLIEIVCQNVTPILMDILVPMSRLSAAKNVSSNAPNSSDIGRGTENLVTNSGSACHILVKTVAYQERNSIYRISLELLRLFGLELSMRPLLEALFHRIFLLPNAEQRVESLIFMQDVMRNPLLVLVLMSNPLCLYGFSSSHSQNLDLFKIFIDAISEAQQSGNVLLTQLSTFVFTTLLSTLDTLAKLDSTKSHDLLKSPIAKMILTYAQQNRSLYEMNTLQNIRGKNEQTSVKYRRTKQNIDRPIDDLLHIKSRIYGYDSQNSQYYCNKRKSVPGVVQESQDSKKYFCEDFNYESRLHSLLEKQQSFNSNETPSLVHLSLENFDLNDSKQGHMFSSGILRSAYSDDALWSSKIKPMSRPFVEFLSEPSVFSSKSTVVTSSSSSSSFISSRNRPFMVQSVRLGDEEDQDEEEEELTVNASTISHFERSLAAIFIRKLCELLPELVKKQSLLLADDILQSFASNYCRDLFRALKLLNASNSNSTTTPALNDLTREEISILQASCHLVDSLFVNADGIYLATYSALLLNLKLLYRNYYESRDPSLIPLTEKQFIDEIYDYRISIYLSPQFLAEIYQRVVDTNLLDILDKNNSAHFESRSLIKLLQDVDVFDLNKPNAYKLSEYARLEATMFKNQENDKHPSQDSMHVIIRRFLAQFWSTILVCFGPTVSSNNAQVFKNTVQVVNSVNKSHFVGLQAAFQLQSQQQLSSLKCEDARLFNMEALLALSVQVQCFHGMDRLYQLFVDSVKNSTSSNLAIGGRIPKSTTLPDLGDRVLSRMASVNSRRNREAISPVSLHCIKTLLNNSAHIGSHCSKIWPRVFELCTFVLELETSLFRSAHSTLLSRARVSIGTILKSNSISQSLSSQASNNASNSSMASNEPQSPIEMQSFAHHLPGISESENHNLETQFDALISGLIRGGSAALELKNSTALEQLIEYLSYFVGQIFESFALKFNLALLGVFVEELCAFSRTQLARASSLQDTKTLMLFRLVEVLLRFVRNGRPLLHFMRIWPTAATHLVECCTCTDSAVAKRAITSMHDIINAALTAYGEPDFFYFNESIFACYERLLLHELCDSEAAEELLLNSICEFVEGAPTEIRSGWRPIFRALRGLRTQLDSAESARIAILSDIFDAYLRTENLHVFSYASADFVACAFHLVRGAARLKSSTDSSSISILGTTTNHESTFITLLKYIQRFCKILRTINAFSDAAQSEQNRLIVSPLIRGRKYKLIQLDRLRRALLTTLDASDRRRNTNDSSKSSTTENCEEQENLDTILSHFELNLQLKSTIRLSDMVDSSRPTPLLQLWCLILEEFANTIATTDLHHRPMLLEVFFPLLGTCSDLDPNRQFVVFLSNHIVVPLMQNLLAETLDPARCTDVEEHCVFLKQWMPVFVRHILRHTKSYYDRHKVLNEGCLLLLKQCLLVTVECFNPEFHDLISWMCLSLLHDILTSDVFTAINSALWSITIDCIQIGHQLTLSPLNSLVDSFENIPLENDFERLRVLSLRIERCTKFVRARANRVFFIESTEKCESLEKQLKCEFEITEKRGDDRDFHILVETNSGVRKCVPFNLLARQTHSHLFLTRIIAQFLSHNVSPSLSTLSPFLFGSETPSDVRQFTPSDSLSLYQYQRICTMLKATREAAIQFDRRPGLKFLVQQISHSKTSANLYQLSGVTWTALFVVDFKFAITGQEYSETLSELFHDCFADYKEKLELRQQILGLTSEQPLTFTSLPALLKAESVNEASSSTDSSSIRANPFDEQSKHQQQQQFQLFSDDNLNQILVDFRRSKDLFSSGHSSGTPTTKTAPNNKQIFLADDFEVYFQLWNEMFANCITVHASLPDDRFYLVLVQLRVLFRHLFMIGDVSNEIRHALQVWIDRIVELLMDRAER